MAEYYITEEERRAWNEKISEMEFCLMPRPGGDLPEYKVSVERQEKEKADLIRLIKLAKDFLKEQYHVDENGKELSGELATSPPLNDGKEIPSLVVVIREGLLEEVISTDPAMKGRCVLKIDHDDGAEDETIYRYEEIRVADGEEIKGYLGQAENFWAEESIHSNCTQQCIAGEEDVPEPAQEQQAQTRRRVSRGNSFTP